MQLAVTHPAQRLEPPLPLAQLTERVIEAARSARDYPAVALPQTRLRPDGTWKFADWFGHFTRHALGQLCARFALPTGGAVPAGYLAHCPSSLVAQNLNWWLTDSRQKGRRVMVRVREGGLGRHCMVHAVLSDRYAVVDHAPLLQTLERMAPEHGLTVRAWSLDDERLTLRLQLEAKHPASPSDPFWVGLHVSNSEVGLGAITLSALITRLVCENGLIVKVADLGGFSRRHCGRIGENLAGIVQEAVPRVLAAADEAGHRFARLGEQAAPWPVEAFIERTARRIELPQERVGPIVAQLEGDSLRDVLNAFTLAA